MSAPTAYDVILSGLRDLGITSLDPTTPANQPFPIEPGDLADVCQILSSSLQEAAQEAGGEQLNQPGSAYIQAPAAISLTATQGSTTVSVFSGFASWMPGCTIRLAGDDQDNELLSATQLARPYVGGSASGITGTVWCDCITLDSSVDHVTGPLVLTQNRFVEQASTRREFAMRICQWNPFPQNIQPQAGWYSLPFWGMSPKLDAPYPTMYFMDTYYDPTLAYVVKRIRLTPMPSAAQSIAWTQKMLPPRVSVADAVSGYTTLTASGATSDTNANQNYTYLCDINGYRAFAGVTHSAYGIYFHPGLSNFVLNSTFNLSATPTAYWKNTTSAGVPIGTFTHQGTATGDITISSSDLPGKVLTMPNGYIENLLMPIFRLQLTRLPTYKNKEIRPEVERQCQMAIRRLRAATVGTSSGNTRYF